MDRLELWPVEELKWVQDTGEHCLFDPEFHFHFADGVHPNRAQMQAIEKEWQAYYKRTFFDADDTFNAHLRDVTRQKTLDLERALLIFARKEIEEEKARAEHDAVEENEARQKLELEILEHVERHMHQWIHDFTVDCMKAQRDGKTFQAEFLLGFVPPSEEDGSFVCVEHETGRIGRLVHQVRHIETGFEEKK